MFGSTILDVFIGLVLIYLLYSLLVTIIGERISSMCNIRAKMLKSAIRTMLVDDTKASSKFSLAENFYNYPSIKYLRKNESNKLPSYITKENFAETLFNMLREKGTGEDDMSKIDFCLKYNTLNIDNETKKHITNLFEAAKLNIDTFKLGLQNWYVETMDRLTGWYKRKVFGISFVLGLLLAVSFNVDSIKIAHMLSKDDKAREHMVQMATAFIKDSAQYKDLMLANNDTELPQAVVQNSLTLIKEDINNANMLLGLGYGFDTLYKNNEIVLDTQKCSKVIKKIDSLYTHVIRPDSLIISFLNRKKQIIDSSIFSKQMRKFENENTKAEIIFQIDNKTNVDENLNNLLKTVEDSIKLYTAKIEAQTKTNKLYSDSISKIEAIQKAVYNDINSLVGNKFTIIQNIDLKNKTIYGKRNYNFWERFGHILKNIFSLSFFGFLITALALSLGAPFWFDLLKKLVSIRGAGIKPDEKDKGENETKPIDPFSPAMVRARRLAVANNKILPNKEDNVEAALRIYSDTIEKIKGVIKVAQGYFKEGDKVERCVQINVEDQDAAVRVKSKYSKLRIGENEFVLSNVLVTGKPTLLGNGTNNKERALANKTLVNGWGSYGCIVKNKYSNQKYILSCFHVFKGDYNYDIIGNHQTIIKQPNDNIASKFEGYFTDQLDIAFAEVSDEIATGYLGKFKNPIKEMPVTVSDIYVTEVFINGLKTTNGSGKIVHDCWSDVFPYPYPKSKIRWHRLNNLIAISGEDKNGSSIPITQEGDSGSIVFDSKGNALGIVVAGDKEHTFAIKMETIISNTDKTLELT